MVSQKPKYCKNFERKSHWRKLFMIMVWERYCNASPKSDFFLFFFSLFIFSFISQLIWVCLGWNFHRWFSIQKQVNWCTIPPFSLKFCTSQHSYPVPLSHHEFPYLVQNHDICARNIWHIQYPYSATHGLAILSHSILLEALILVPMHHLLNCHKRDSMLCKIIVNK